MKTRWMVTVLLIASLCIMAGCSKKEEPVKPAAEPDAQEEATGMMDSMKETTTEAVEKAAETTQEAGKDAMATAKEVAETVKESLSMDIDMAKTVSDLKAEAAKMDVESLTKIAMKYKDAIAEKQATLKPLMDKLKAIPMTEKLGEEATTLTTKIKKLTESIAPLKERFGVYVDAIKAKGGDVKDLML
ncbi:MAG: hypothetical protein ISS71_01915 [Phycisphaerae bacterium]|nr:hypothetical protein [Phycisphaerae bacterium]